MKKKIWMIPVMVLLMAALLGGCSSEEDDRKLATQEYVPVGSQDTRLENEQYELVLEDNYSGMVLKNKENGEVWSSKPTDEHFDFEALNPLWKQKTSSLFQIGYTNIMSGLGVIVNSPLLQMDYTAEGYLAGETLYVSYDLQQPAIRLTLAFTLEEDGFRIRVPYEGIEEYGDSFSLVTISVLPFMAGATDSAEGYYLYPDGSGAIMEFQDISHVGVSSYSYDIYGDIEDYEQFATEFDATVPSVMLPVYGVNVEDRGYVAVITEGEADSRITVSCSTEVIPLNSIFGEFVYRRGFEDSRIKTSTVMSYAGEIIDGDKEIYYRFMENGNTDYNAMAENYRSYLESSYEGSMQCKGYPLMLDIFMGIQEEGLVYDEFKEVTDFEEAGIILEELDSRIEELQVNLKGYTKNGYDSEPLKFSVNGTLGGKKGLKNLLTKAASLEIPVTLDVNLVNAWEKQGGFSNRTDIIYLGNFAALTDKEEELFILSPEVAVQNLQAFAKKADSYDIAGYSISGMGQKLAYNYNENHRFTSQETKGVWTELLQQLKTAGNQLVTEGGNQYVLEYADYVKGIPTEDQAYRFSSKSVPFYQLVVHGMVGYTGEAGNLTGNLEKTKLKWVEYGYLPYFELTYDGSEELMYTGYNELFTSEYANWKADVAQIYDELNKAVGFLSGVKMVRHECLETDFYCVTYADGTKIYVNYAEGMKTAGDVLVAPMSYSIVKGEK